MPGFARALFWVIIRSFAVFGVIFVAACSGSDSANPSSADRTEQGIVDTNPSPVTEDLTPNPEADNELESLDAEVKSALQAVSSEMYFRRPEYPAVVNLPLQFITTKGGKKLSVRVALPATAKGVVAEGPFPVVLTQTAYNSNLLSIPLSLVPGNALLGVTDSYLVRRGYAQVAVDALGTGASEGGWELLGEDEQIGFADAVDWVDQQPWSNGKLGVAGVSYMAISSLFSAQRRPDSIDAVFASLPMGDAMRGTVGVGGMLNAVFMSQWMTLTHFLSTQNIPTELLYPKYMAQLIKTTEEHVAQVDRYHLPLINDALDGAPYVTYDSEFWRTRSPLENIDKVKAPTFIFGALDDIFQRDEPLFYEALKENGVEAKLVIYSGTHSLTFLASHIGNQQVPPVDFLMIQWFDKYLRGMDSRTEQIPAVVQHVKNYPTPSTPDQFKNDSYATASSWPHPLAKPERWYLRQDSKLSPRAPEAEEMEQVMTQPPHAVGRAYEKAGLLKFDLTINDGTRCTRSFYQWVLGMDVPRACYYNTENTEQQRVIFESEPMAEDYYINGPIQADIWIESTVTEAVVAVQIEEVVSGQKSKPLTNGILVASGRAVDETRSRFLAGEMIQPYHYFTEEQSQPLVPGEVVKMPIEIFPTSAIIRKGNKLRVSISPSNQAQAVLNYPRQAAAEGGTTTIHISPDYPSSVVLPIVPTSALN